MAKLMDHVFEQSFEGKAFNDWYYSKEAADIQINVRHNDAAKIWREALLWLRVIAAYGIEQKYKSMYSIPAHLEEITDRVLRRAQEADVQNHGSDVVMISVSTGEIAKLVRGIRGLQGQINGS